MIKMIKLHLSILILLGLPTVLVPLTLWGPFDTLPDRVGILALLYLILWFLHTLLTSFFMGTLSLFQIGRTSQAVISIHVVIFIIMLIYAIFLLAT